MVLNNPTPHAVYSHLQKISTPGSYDREAVARYGGFVGSKIESHEHLDRAMLHARNKIEALAASGKSVASGTVILADTMRHSKGRFSRVWHAPAGGVWGCLIHANTLLPQSRSFIPFAVGVACCEAVHEAGMDKAVLRWVNDVLVEGRKLAGFLVETYTESHFGEEYNIVGFGINVNNIRFPDELSNMAISLKELLGETVALSKFTALFLARLAWNFGLLYHEEASDLRGEGFSGKKRRHLLLDRWRQLSDTVGKNVVYGFDVMNAPQYQGRVLRMDDSGGIVLRLRDGFEKTEYSGEVRYM